MSWNRHIRRSLRKWWYRCLFRDTLFKGVVRADQTFVHCYIEERRSFHFVSTSQSRTELKPTFKAGIRKQSVFSSELSFDGYSRNTKQKSMLNLQKFTRGKTIARICGKCGPELIRQDLSIWYKYNINKSCYSITILLILNGVNIYVINTKTYPSLFKHSKRLCNILIKCWDFFLTNVL